MKIETHLSNANDSLTRDPSSKRNAEHKNLTMCLVTSGWSCSETIKSSSLFLSYKPQLSRLMELMTASVNLSVGSGIEVGSPSHELHSPTGYNKTSITIMMTVSSYSKNQVITNRIGQYLIFLVRAKKHYSDVQEQSKTINQSGKVHILQKMIKLTKQIFQ